MKYRRLLILTPKTTSSDPSFHGSENEFQWPKQVQIISELLTKITKDIKAMKFRGRFEVFEASAALPVSLLSPLMLRLESWEKIVQKSPNRVELKL